MRARVSSLSVLVALSLGACTPTISAPRGAAHLAAMRDATRHFHHGRLEAAADSWAEAAETAERRVDREEATYRRARALVRMGRWEDGLETLDRLARHRPVARRQVRARFDAALLRREHALDAERAERALMWIVREHPDTGPAGRALRLLLADREGAAPAAQIAFLDGLHASVGSSDLGDDVLAARAEIRAEAGDRAGAMADLEQLVEEHPYPHGQRWDDALWRLADLAQEASEPTRAIAYLERMIAIHEETFPPGSHTLPRFPEARLRIARIYRDELDDPERAAASFRATHDVFSRSRLRDDALLELGAMWLDGGRRAEGCATLRQLVAEFEVGHPRRLAQRRIEAECVAGSGGG